MSKNSLFFKKSLQKKLKFEPKGFDFFLDRQDITKAQRNTIEMILRQAKLLPAGLREFHGNYTGGLYDHTLLVTNYTHHINEISAKKPMNKEKISLASIYHDFGKISYYGLKRKLPNRKVKVKMSDRKSANRKNQKVFNLNGIDNHVDECIAVLDVYDLPYDKEIHRSILFHHGSYSIYEPYTPNRLANLINVADMIAVNIHEV
ncbi:MAG: hypothetical protein BAJALOKI2v1_70015 [Promethearchaeota archaeon]|nr:MAG: hypothetical protein BAJALOKI2v1_70015 [Candidatus Lokiarchaeota archaeon]